MTGNPDCPYINHLAGDLLDAGYQPVIYNYRVFSKDYKIDPKENVNIIEDVQHTLEYIKEQHPKSQIYAIGASYGANQLVNYLGTYKVKNI